MSKPLRIVVLASGHGSNLRAIVRAIDSDACAAQLVGVVSDRSKSGALAFAEERGVPSRAVPLKKGDDRNAWNVELTEQVAAFEPELVVLAGFMRIVDSTLLERFPGRVINLHPSLLPAFPGHNATELAIAAGVRISGCTVHVVDAGVDSGPIIAQAAVPVWANDTAETLHERIKVQEHRLLPQTIDWVARGIVELNPVRIHRTRLEDEHTLVSPRFSS